MTARLRAGLVAIVLLAGRILAQSASFPPGTTQFFRAGARDVVDALDGGVWIATAPGIVHYTAAGPGTALPVSGAVPHDLELSRDRSIWFATPAQIGRLSPTGVLLEQHDVSGAYRLTEASDGALWFQRSYGGVLCRLTAGGLMERPAPPGTAALAAAPGGDLWILPAGFGASSDSLYRMTPSGSLTAIPLGIDVLFGSLRALPDGTLYIGSGIRGRVYRLEPGAQAVEPVRTASPAYYFTSDLQGNVWTGTYSEIGYTGVSGAPVLSLEMPSDPRNCANIPAYVYAPLTVDAAGGVWMSVFDDALYLPEPIPCPEPEPPELPTLIRIDSAAFLAAYDPEHIPALSPLMLAAFALGLSVVAIVLRMR